MVLNLELLWLAVGSSMSVEDAGDFCSLPLKLESEACRARAGESACQGVLRGLNALIGGRTALEV